MHKPDWSSAPEWAEWLAMDGNGQWFWYRIKPKYDRIGWYPEDAKYKHAGVNKYDDFQLELAKTLSKTTLEKRP